MALAVRPALDWTARFLGSQSRSLQARLLAADAQQRRVVIELKAGTADGDAVGQILSYMGDIQVADAKTPVRGILIAGGLHYKSYRGSERGSSYRVGEIYVQVFLSQGG